MIQRSLKEQVLGLVLSLLIAFAAAAIGSIATANASGFYEDIERPSWAPPASVFGPVWSALYLLMGIAAWQVWRRRGFQAARLALGLYLAQLLANALWSWLFFAWREGAWAFFEIVLLWLLILATLVTFWRADRLAGALLLPYFAWVSFATALCYATWQANPSAL